MSSLISLCALHRLISVHRKSLIWHALSPVFPNRCQYVQISMTNWPMSSHKLSITTDYIQTLAICSLQVVKYKQADAVVIVLSVRSKEQTDLQRTLLTLVLRKGTTKNTTVSITRCMRGLFYMYMFLFFLYSTHVRLLTVEWKRYAVFSSVAQAHFFYLTSVSFFVSNLFFPLFCYCLS